MKFIFTPVSARCPCHLYDRNGQHRHHYGPGLAALGLQGFLIMICVGIYAVLVNALSLGGDLQASIWSCAAYTVLLCFSLFKTGSVAKSILNAH